MLALCFFKGLPITDSSGNLEEPNMVLLISSGIGVSCAVSGGVVPGAGVPTELGDLRELRGSAEC